MNDPAIDVKGLVKRFGGLTAVAGVDLQIARNSCVGLLGPNGAGKTTTVEILEGLQEPSEGTVQILGKSWQRDGRFLRGKVGVALQETRLNEKLTVEETLRLFRSFFSSGATVEDALTRVNLGEKRDARVGDLSGGQRQRLALATALVGDPELLFLDEPTTGLDPQSRRSLWDVIVGLRARGCTVLLTTHYMEEAERLCDRVVILDHGRIVADGTPAALIASVGASQIIELTAQPPLPRATLDALPGVTAVHETDGAVQLSVGELHVSLPAVLEAVRGASAVLVHLTTRAGTLDDVFLAYTGRRLRDDGAP